MIQNTTEAPAGFDYVDLTTVDPSNSIPQAVYSLKIAGAELKPHINGPNSKSPGAESQKIQFKFTVLEGEFAGRRIPATVFWSSIAPVFMRKLMDATGVAQEQGEAFSSWLARLADTAPDFKVLVKKDDRGNDVDWRTAQVNG